MATDRQPAAALAPERRTGVERRYRADAIGSVLKRNRELDRRTYRALAAVLTLAVALAVSVTGNVLMALHRPQPLYFAQDQRTGTLTPLIPLDRPIANKGVVLQRAADALVAINSIDFKNYRKQLQDASSYFTPTGWQRYLTEFQSTGTLDAMQKHQLVLSGIVSQPPVITGEGTVFGAYYWNLEVPFKVSWQGADFNQTTSYVAQIKVVRVPSTDDPTGIAIAQLVVRTALNAS